MALPGDITLVTVSGTYTQLDGSAAVGTVTFSTSQPLIDGTGDVVIPKGSVVATLDETGAFTVDLPATDDSDVSPTGFTYRVIEEFTSPKVSRSYSVSLPSADTDVDISELEPVDEVGAVSTYLQKSGGTMTGALTLSGSGSNLSVGGNLTVATAGKGLQVKEGSNAKMGTATLVTGTKVVSTTAVTASSRIFITTQSLGTVTAPKVIAVTARTAGTSFTLTSTDNTDTSVVAWMLVEPSA